MAIRRFPKTGTIAALTLLCVHGVRAQSQDLYVSDSPRGTIDRFTVAADGTVSNSMVPYISGQGNPLGIAFDNSGNLYIDDSGGNVVNRVPINSPGSSTPIATGFNNPFGNVIGPDGSLFVANDGDGTVARVTFNADRSVNTVTQNFLAGFSNPEGLAFDAAGNLFITNESANTISEVMAGATTATTLTASTLLSGPVGLAFDAQGNLFVANSTGNTIDRITFSSAGSLATIADTGERNLSGPYGLAFDAMGALYAADFTGDQNLGGAITRVTLNASGMSTGSNLIATGLGNPAFLAFHLTATAATPEPGSGALLMVVVLPAMGFVRRRLHR